MNTNEKFAALNKVVAETKMTEEEITKWFQSRKPIFPLAYNKGSKFEILPELIPERKDEIWGYEIMPNFILARKCGKARGVWGTSWSDARIFAGECVINEIYGHLPSKKVLEQNWNMGLANKIKQMDKFLYERCIDAERDYIGIVRCSDVDNDGRAYYLCLTTGNVFWGIGDGISKCERLMVTF